MADSNEYDDILSGQVPQGNEYDDMLAGERDAQKTQIQQSLFAAQDSQPDRKAEVLRISERTKLPPNIVERNFDDLAKRQVGQDLDYDNLISNSPGLAKFLEDTNNAALAKDDLDSQKALEQKIQDHTMMDSMYNAIGYGFAKMNESVARIPGLLYDTAAIPQNLFMKAIGRPERQVRAPEWLAENPVAEHYKENTQAFQQQIPELSQSAFTEISNGNFVRAGQIAAAQLVANAPQQAAMLLSAMTGYGTAGLVGAGLTTASDKNQEARDANFDPVTGTATALANGMIESGFEHFGTFGQFHHWENAVAKQVGKVGSREFMKSVVKTIGHSALGEANEEFWTSVAQDLTDYGSGLNPNATEGLFTRAADAGIVGGLSGVSMTAPSAIGTATARSHSVQRSVDFYSQLGDVVQQTKLLDRMPERQRDLIQMMTEGTPVENVYIPVQALNTYFQDKKANPVQVMQAAGVLKEYNEAQETGADVKIPLAQWVTGIVKSEHYEGLANDIKFSPDGVTMNEAKVEMEIARQIDEELKKQADAATRTDQEITADQSAAQIRQTVAEQLKVAGVDPQQAVLYESAFKSLGDRMGVDPMELFNRFNLKIGYSDQALNGAGTFNQPARSVVFPVKQSAEGVLSVNPGEGLNAAARIVDGKMLIDGLYFDSKYQGVGQDMIRSLERSAIAKGAFSMEGLASSKRLQDVYEAQGFEVQDETKDGAVMFKDLSGKRIYNQSATQSRETEQTQFPMPEQVSVTQAQDFEQTTEDNASKVATRGKFTNAQTGFEIAVNAQTIKKAISQGRQQIKGSSKSAFQTHLDALQFMDRLIENAVYLTTSEDAKGRGEKWHYLFSPMNINGQNQLVKLEVAEKNGNFRLHNYAVVKAGEVQSEGLSQPLGQQPEVAGSFPAALSIGDFMNEVNAARPKHSFFQEDDGGPQGQIQIGKDGINIAILKDADESTFFHETGHFYLQVLETLSTGENAPQQIKDDFLTIREWLGAAEGQRLSVEQHEQFARGFEAYLMEGKAPSSKLRKAFARFKVWLIAVYKNLRSLNVDLTDDVRSVMDRLLATDEEINQAQAVMNMEPLFNNPEGVGLKGDKLDRYLEARDEARFAAEEQVSRKIMADYQREKESWWKKERSKVRSEIEKDVGSRQIYRALSIIQRGKLPDGSPLPEGTQEFKLNKKAIVEQYGKEFLKRLPKPYVYAANDGLHPDVAAELLGFESGDSMLTQFANAPKRDVLIDQLTDKRMSENYPDLLHSNELADEAIKAVHNEGRAKLLRLELEHLASNDMPTLKDVIRRVARRVPTQRAVREQAVGIIAQRKVGDLSPYLFQRAESKAAKEAGDALAAGDIDQAFEWKQRELLNHELYRAAVEAQENVDDAQEFFKKLNQADDKLAKSRDMDLVNAARAILSTYGIGIFDDPAEKYLKPIQQYDPETYSTIEALVGSVLRDAGKYDAVPYDTFQTMADTVKSLWDLAKSTRQVEIDGLAIDRGQVIDELSVALNNMRESDQRTGYEKKVSDWDKTKMGLLGVRAALRRVESWVDAIDAGDINGPFRRYIWNPISEGTTKYREAKKAAIQKYLEVVKGVEGQLDQKEIPAPELKWMGQDGRIRSYTFSGKQELLGALLHTGNESNLSKLLRGREWGTEDVDGNLDTSQWDAFIARMQREGVLAKADYDFVQGVWDLLESIKPEAQKAHKKMYGFYFDEITHKEFQTPFGKYKGGYVPAVADPFIAIDASIREEKAALEGMNNSFMFPTAGRGFTKKRVHEYARPLSLDLSLVPGHIDKVLRFVHIEPRVKEVGRVVMDRGFRNSLDAFDPAAGGDMLVPWLQRAALQKIETPSQGWAGKAADRFFKTLRTRVGFQVMTANVTNALQQITGLSIAALKVKPRHLRDSLWTYVKAPTATSEAIQEKSAFMRTKLSASSAEVQQAIDDMLLNPTKYEKARDFAMKHGYFFQSAAQNVVDQVVWSGAYDQSVSEGMNELEAVRTADAAVRQTQGSFAAEDISRFETGSPFMRAFTMFYSYFNMLTNLLGTEVQKVSREMGLKKGAGRLLYIYNFGFMIPAVVSELVVRAMAGKIDDDDDDEYLDDAMNIFFGSQFRMGTAMIPGVGSAIQAGVNAWNDKWYDDRISTSPAIAMIESAVSAPHSVYESITGDGSRKKAVRDTLTLLGLMTGLPLAPISRPVGYLSDVAEGDAQPGGPVDFTRGLISGKSGQSR